MPWENDGAWDDAIKAAGGVNVGGELSEDGTSSEFLYRRDQLVCDSTVWTEPRNPAEEEVRDRLRDAGAREISNDDDARAGTADRLGLRLLEVPSEQAHALVRTARGLAPDAVCFNHVLVANPQRYGGCAPPVLSTDPVANIPGTPTEGAALKIAVLDTGIAEGVPFAVDPASDVEPSGFSGQATGHGTMVAAIVARFAGGATILVKQVLSLPLGIADELEIAAALDALPRDVDVINASFSGPAADDERMLALQRALDRLPESTLVIAAAGNEDSDRPRYMAAFDRVVGVTSAGDVDGQLAVFDYSNHGDWIDLSTQGTDVETINAVGEFVRATGTSFAAPKIAAEAMKLPGGTSSVTEAAEWLITQSGGPAIQGGGTFIATAMP